MYTKIEREKAFNDIIKFLKSINLIEGIVQLGSGTKGYNDEFSDIDLMVPCFSVADVIHVRSKIQQYFINLGATYVKIKTFKENDYLVIAFLPNNLEFDVSVLPTSYLNVQSPNWKVAIDKTGNVTKKMEVENKCFLNRPIPYRIVEDIDFEFVLCMLRVKTEIKRNNLIFAFKMLDTARDYVLQLQVLNENKKLHQFKAYHTLNQEFVKAVLETYPMEISSQCLNSMYEKLIELFISTINSSTFHLDEKLLELL